MNPVVNISKQELHHTNVVVVEEFSYMFTIREHLSLMIFVG